MTQLKASLRAKIHQWQDFDPNDDEGREKLLQEMLAMLTDENVAEIIQSLSVEEMNTDFGSGALHRWMQVDPTVASNWLAARAETTQDQTITVAEDWNKHPEDLQKYLEQLSDTPWKQNLLTAASADMTMKDPEAAIKLAQQIGSGDALTNSLRSVANAWVSADPEAALKWVTSVKDPALREQLIASAVQAYALTDPAQAATWLISEVKSEAIVKETAINIVETWVAESPADAANWVSQFPEGETKVAAVKVISGRWRQIDPAAANAWVQRMGGEKETQAD